jgi:hypothetical protein
MGRQGIALFVRAARDWCALALSLCGTQSSQPRKLLFYNAFRFDRDATNQFASASQKGFAESSPARPEPLA